MVSTISPISYKINKIIKRSLRFLAYFIGILLAYIIIAWCMGYWAINRDNYPPIDTETVDVYIISNGMHTDIMMPMEHARWQWRNWISERDTNSPNHIAQYVAIGWGDKGFYLNTPTWHDLTVYTAVRAILGLNETALHVSFYPKPPNPNHAQVVRLMLTLQQYETLAQSISRSFVQTEGHSIPIKGAHYGWFDVFYESHGRYSLWNTCNTWVNEQLKTTRAPAVQWTIFAQPFMQSLKSY